MHFSFFGSHVNLILEPNQNFRNLREYIEYLPLDYYILLQKGYREKKKVAWEQMEREVARLRSENARLRGAVAAADREQQRLRAQLRQ